MKRPSLCAIALAITLATLAFFEIRETVTGDKQFFLVRMLFRKPGYASNIEVKPYLLNNEQVLQSFLHPQEALQQPLEKELFLKNVNVVLRIANRGHAVAWGTLAYSVDHVNWFKIDVILDPVKNDAPFCEYVIPMGRRVFWDDELPQKPIQFRWNSLYVKY